MTKQNEQEERGREQALAIAQEKAREAREVRIRSHNMWPLQTPSQAERDFALLIDELKPSLLLTPFPFSNGNPAPDFHRHLGMLIDSMEMLPGRPDHAFDICFRIVDELAQSLTNKGTITDALSNLGTFVCNNLASSPIWKDAIREIAQNCPPVAGRFLAQRLLEVFQLSKDSLRSRGADILGIRRYEQLFQKFRTDQPTSSIAHEAERLMATANNRAGEFLQLLVSQRVPLIRNVHTSYSELDLSKAQNLLSEGEALNCMLSLLAFTARNERVHGSSLSPFRSSKASLTTYASYYFQFHLLYAVAVGLIVESFPGCGTIGDWRQNVTSNFTKYSVIFKRFARKS